MRHVQEQLLGQLLMLMCFALGASIFVTCKSSWDSDAFEKSKRGALDEFASLDF